MRRMIEMIERVLEGLGLVEIDTRRLCGIAAFEVMYERECSTKNIRRII